MSPSDRRFGKGKVGRYVSYCGIGGGTIPSCTATNLPSITTISPHYHNMTTALLNNVPRHSHTADFFRLEALMRVTVAWV